MFNRKGISDIVRYDEAAVTERFGITPSQYLDFVALKGDTSDNIPGVPGVGDKTAAKLINQFGTVEELLANTDQLKGKQKENVEASAGRLPLNKELAQIVTDVPLPVTPDDCVMGDWDAEEVRRLFTSLEFRSLFDRLQDVGHAAKPKVEVAELDLREVTADELPTTWSGGSPGRRAARRRRRSRSEGWRRLAGRSAGGLRAAAVADTARRVPCRRRRSQVGPRREGVRAGGAFPGCARGRAWRSTRCSRATSSTRPPPTYPLDALCETYLGADVLGSMADEDEGQLFSEAGWRVARGRSGRGGPAGPRDGGEDRPAGPARRCSKTSSSRWPRCSRAWRHGASASTSPYLGIHGRVASANAWPR